MKKFVYLTLLSMSLFQINCKEESTGEVEPATTGSIEGYVKTSSDGAPLDQVHITTKNSTSAVITDANGYYVISDIQPGNYTLTAAKINFDTATTNVSVNEGILTRADFILSLVKNPGELMGRVYNAANDSAIAGANITTDPHVGSINTDLQGRFFLYSVPPGSYSVSVSKFGFISQSLKTSVISDSVRTIEFVLEPLYGEIRGLVTDAETNLPIEGVNIRTNPPTSSVTTDTNGRYVILNVPKLTSANPKYTISAQKAGYENATVDVNVLPGEITEGDILMTRSL